jgi:hypothetical protein
MQTNLLTTLSVQQLQRAIAIREQIDGLEKELNQITGGQTARSQNGAGAKKRRMSAAAKARISAAMKARWAKRSRPMSVKSRRVAKAPRAVSAKQKTSSQRGQLKQKIIQSLKAAGNSGLTVKDLAKKTGKSYGNISVWFYSTAKGVNEIKKVGPGKYAWAA